VIDIYTHMLPWTVSSKQQFLDAAKYLVSQGVKGVSTTLDNFR